jgi:hypothetical protein
VALPATWPFVKAGPGDTVFRPASQALDDDGFVIGRSFHLHANYRATFTGVASRIRKSSAGFISTRSPLRPALM